LLPDANPDTKKHFIDLSQGLPAFGENISRLPALTGGNGTAVSILSEKKSFRRIGICDQLHIK
jgi:hypothetical protein